MRFISTEPGRYNGKVFRPSGLKGNTGVFETDNEEDIEMLKNTIWFKRGQIILADVPKKEEKKEQSEFQQLRAKAKALGIKNYLKMKKEELKDAIDNAHNAS